MYNVIINSYLFSESKVKLYLKKFENNSLNQIIDLSKDSFNIENTSLNVKDFGAKGNGIANDIEAIQKAINSCNEGDEVYIPRGEYLIEDTIYLKSNISIRLDKDAVIYSNEKLQNKSMLIGENVINVSIKGGNLDGYTVESNHINFPIKFINSSKILIKNMIISNFKNGIIIKDSNKCRVTKCIISNLMEDKTGGIGITFDNSYDGIILSNIITNIYQDGILVYNNSYKVMVIDNSISNWNLENDYGRAGIQAYFSKDILISNNICYCDDKRTINDFPTLRTGIRARDSYNISIVYNKVKDCQGIGIESIFLGDNSNYSQNNIKIIANKIYNVYGVGISNSNIITNEKLIGRVIISNNTIKGVKYININNSGNGIVSKALNHNISKNKIINCDDTSITGFTNNGSLLINNNIMKNAGLNYKTNNKSYIFINGENIKVLKNIILESETTMCKYAIRLYGENSKSILSKNIVPEYLKNKIDGTMSIEE